LRRIAKLLLPGARSIIVESLLLKYQLLILNRSRARAPNLRPVDRIIASLCAGLIRPARLLRSAIVLKPSTLMAFHWACVSKISLALAPRWRGKAFRASLSKLRKRLTEAQFQRLATQLHEQCLIDISSRVKASTRRSKRA